MRVLKSFLADQFAQDEYKDIFFKIYDLGSIFFIFGDVYQVTTGTILRSLGLHDFAALFMFIGYYCMGMPLSVILVYVAKLEVYGVWIALIAAACSISIVLFIRILKVDYEVCVDCVKKRFEFE